MKLRIDGNSIRLRLKRNEVEVLHERGLVEEALDLGPAPNAALRYAIAAHADERVAVTHRDGELRVSIPEAWANELATTDRVGYDFELLQGNGVLIRVLIETDLPCAHDKEKSTSPAAATPATAAS
jgi:hypothetical protein